ncbi:MAG TPA: phosphatase PAP2 family protein [Candidatus Sulfotelmatobacter sp.]|jgi:undecaprenyl-diphosphatase|nr:phosphatase PAP2 family protein [Candidatus Sulfotelmatobacter sp.]
MSEVHPKISGPEEVPAPTPLFETAIVVSLGVAVLCLFLFAWLGREMLEGDTRHLDDAVRTWVHHFASGRMTTFMNAVSLLGYNILIVELVIVFIVFAKLRWRRAAVWLAITMAGSLLLDLALKYAYQRPRPVAFFGVAPGSYSFPSGHALCSLCFYGILAGLLSARIQSLLWRIVVWAAAALLIITIGVSRIYLGVHYPSDVLAGYLAATVWVGTVIVLDHVRKVRSSRQIVPK